MIKKHGILPPRPVKREKDEPVALLEEKESMPPKKRAASNFQRTPSNRLNVSNASGER